MRIPDTLASLHDQGIISEVLRPLMSGKEAQIYLVSTSSGLAVAKIYKEANNRSFRQRAAYTEGRKVRNSRDQRAMAKRTKYGREQEEAGWSCTEVDMIHRLHAGGVRVPVPHFFVDGVLVMELVTDADGNPAPRLGDVSFEPEVAKRIYDRLIREVVRMLCVGVVHGDMSDFNVLVGADGPVIIDFPQSVDTAHNTNARQLLLRDVDNLHRFLKRWVPNAPRLPYAEEMWDLHQNNSLTPNTPLTGRYNVARRHVNVDNVLGLIDDANRDERRRREAAGLRGRPPARDGNAQPPRTRNPNPPDVNVRTDSRVARNQAAPNVNVRTDGRVARNQAAPNVNARTDGHVARNQAAPNVNARTDGRVARNQAAPNVNARTDGHVARNQAASNANVRTDGRVARNQAAPNANARSDGRMARNQAAPNAPPKQASANSTNNRTVPQHSAGRRGPNVEVIVMRRPPR
jgi:RIO kinase 1